MNPRYSSKYLDGLISSDTHRALVQISSLLCACDRFSKSERDYALPQSLFVLVETLAWEAQSWRSGAWTYYEATPLERQDAMQGALEAIAPLPLAHCYAKGRRIWRDERAIRAVDDWIKSHQHEVIGWLQSLMRANRATIGKLVRGE